MTEPFQDARTGRGRGPASIVVERRIEWSDTDASGNYHNTAVFRLIEVAETALLDRLGFVHDIYGRLPRVHIEADFSLPLRFRDLVEMRLSVASVGRTSVTYAFELRKAGGAAAHGRCVAVLLREARGDPEPWPPRVRNALLGAGPQSPERLISS
jgi:YbgC/YbaW family acyl-CoA thioester hydrolase